MLNRLWSHHPAGPLTADLLAGLMRADAHSRVALMVLVLGPRLSARFDLAKCLQLAAVGDMTAEAADGLGGPLPGLVREQADGVSREARLIVTLRRLSRQMELNRISACRWSEEDRRRLFDPDFLARRCACDPLLAELCDLVWRQGVERLRQTGENPAAVALDVMGYRDYRDYRGYRRVTAVRLP
jgi:hypothetical protein